MCEERRQRAMVDAVFRNGDGRAAARALLDTDPHGALTTSDPRRVDGPDVVDGSQKSKQVEAEGLALLCCERRKLETWKLELPDS